MSIFSDRLKLLREQSSYTQKEMAEMLGMTQSNYSKYEYGTREPNLENIDKISDIFDVSIDFLFGKEPKQMDVVPVPVLVDIIDEQLIYDEDNSFPLPKTYVAGPTFLYELKDDSMKQMDIEKGDHAIVQVTKDLIDADIGLFIAKEQILVRKITFMDNSVVLTPADEKSLPLLDLKENVSIIGKVIGIFKSV